MIDDKLVEEAYKAAEEDCYNANGHYDSYVEGYIKGYRACEKRQEGGKIEEIHGIPIPPKPEIVFAERGSLEELEYVKLLQQNIEVVFYYGRTMPIFASEAIANQIQEAYERGVLDANTA